MWNLFVRQKDVDKDLSSQNLTATRDNKPGYQLKEQEISNNLNTEGFVSIYSEPSSKHFPNQLLERFEDCSNETEQML